MRTAAVYLCALGVIGFMMLPALDGGRMNRIGQVLLSGTVSLMVIHAVWGTLRSTRDKKHVESVGATEGQKD